MRLPLDTATFLFAALDDPRLRGTSLGLIRDPDNEVYLSVVSGWEIAVKHAPGRLDLPDEAVRRYPIPTAW